MPRGGSHDAPPDGRSPSCRPGARPRGCHPVGMHRRPAALIAALLLSATGVLAGCGQQTGTDEAASTGSASTSAAAPDAATDAAATDDPAGTGTPATEPAETDDGAGSGAPFPADTSPDSAEPVDPAGLTVTDVRVGAHEGFDRVVLEVGGEGTPGWDVRYVDSATAEGSGDPIDLAGPAYLRVTLTGVSYPYESGVDEQARGAVGGSGTRAVTGAWYDGTFEGQALAYVGTSGEQPFRVYALSDPTRVVVEVATG